MRRSLAAFSVWPLLLVLLTFTAALAAERLRIVVGGDHENPPYEFMEDGKPTGFNIDLMRAVADAVGADVEFRLGPWSKVRRELEQGKIDALAGMYYSEERSKAVDFSLPHTMVTAGLFLRGDSHIRSMEDIKGKEVIVQKGDVIDDYLRKNGIASRIIEVKDPADVLRLLASGRHDCALMPSRFQGEYLLKVLGISNVRVTSANLPQFRYCFAVKKGNSSLKYRLDEGLNILKVNGKYQKIYDKWFGVYEQSRLWRTVRYFVWALGLITGLLAASSIWSWILRREVRNRTAELRRREEELRFTQYAIDKSIDQAFWMTRDGRLFYVNDAACRTLGYTREELLGMSIPDIDPIYQPEKFAEHWRDLQENGHATFETLHRAKDGRVYPVDIRANYVVFDGKEYNCSFATDISERKRADEALRESEEKFRVLAETSPAAIIVYQEEKNVYINPYATQLIGYTEREFLEMSFWDWMHPDSKELVKERGLARQRGELVPSRYEIKYLTKNGEEKWIFVSAGRIEYKGKPAGIATMFDITDRKRMEVELREAHDELEIRVEERTLALRNAKEEWERTFASVPDLIAILDNRHRVLRVNEAMAKRLGLKPDVCVGLHCYEAIHGLSEPPEFCPHTQTLMDGRKHVVEVHEERLGGDFLVSTIPLNDERGVMIGSVHIAYDITERKRAEEALRESESRVRRKLESILDPEGDIGELDLADIIDAPQIQALMDELYHLAGLKMSIIDLKGRVLVDVGWQDVCLKFHRAHPETLKNCHESDTDLTVGVPPGEFRTYRCRNNMWHIVTPIIVGGKHMGNLFMGQFFFDNEQLDYDLFRSQASRYGFPEEEYIAALEVVPRHSEEWVNMGKAVFLRLTDMFSKLSYGNIKLSHLLAERDRLTATLQKSEAQLKIAMDLAKLGPWEYDVGTGLFTFDDQFYALYGTTAEREGGTLMPAEVYARRFIPPEESAIVANGIAETQANSSIQLEHRIIRADGEERFIVVRAEAIFDQEGRFVKIRGANQDITERKRAEEELKQKKKMLEELNSTLEKRVQEEVTKNREKDIVLIQQNRQAALGEMFDHIAHQWKQPLNSIAVIIQALGSISAHEQVTGEYILGTVDSVMDMVGHMAQTVDVFRNFYNPDKEKSVFLIKDSIDKALNFVMPVFRRYGIEVDLDADPELLAFGYPKEYAQVLLNILANAKDAFMDRVVENPRINVKAFADGDSTVVTITDNAGGVPDLSIESIFDLNFTTKESSGGTGIGLYMSKNIIEKNMGGMLSVCNVEQGAQFRIELGAR